MTKQLKLSIIATAVLLIGFITFGIATYNKSDSDSKQIADLEYQMNELRKAKEKCYDDLTYYESEQARLGFTQPCVMYDEEIMALREKADNLKAKSYEKPVGLSMDR